VLVTLPSLVASLAILLVLVAINGSLGPWVLLLPAVLLLQVLFQIGVVYTLSPLALVLPDLSYFTGLSLTFLMFLSPIAFRIEMVPDYARVLVYLNPIYYISEAYRAPLLEGRLPHLFEASLYLAMCLGTFALGSAFFRRFQGALADFE